MVLAIIENDSRFRELWASSLTVMQIAEIYGLSGPGVVSNAAKRFGLPGRNKDRRRTPRPAVISAAREDAAPEDGDTCPTLAPTDFWTRNRDARVWNTDGRYAAISALAAEWGVASTRVMARWHLLRVAG